MTNTSRNWPPVEQFTFDSPTVTDVLDDISKFVDSFAVNGIVVFKDAYYSEFDVLRILTKMGKCLGWTPNQDGSE
jgi:hypothetical protein